MKSCLLIATALFGVAQAPSGNAVIRRRVGSSDIILTTTTRLAGAIARSPPRQQRTQRPC